MRRTSGSSARAGERGPAPCRGPSLPSSSAGNMMYPLVRELADKDAPIRVPVAVTCRVLKIARQPYYRWLANPVSEAELTEAYRANALFDAHRDDRSSATGSWSIRPATPVSRWQSGRRDGPAPSSACGRRSGRSIRGGRRDRPDRRPQRDRPDRVKLRHDGGGVRLFPQSRALEPAAAPQRDSRNGVQQLRRPSRGHPRAYDCRSTTTSRPSPPKPRPATRASRSRRNSCGATATGTTTRIRMDR